MKLEDIDYFSAKKQSQPSVFGLAQKVFDACQTDPGNAAEMQRRLTLLTRYKDAEHLRQCANFIAELVAFNELTEQGFSPKWLPESTVKGVKTPDIEYVNDGVHMPVEVKHLNDPRDEHEATYAGKSTGGSVDLDYQTLLAQKVNYLVGDAKTKFEHYHTNLKSDANAPSTLYLFFTKSNNAAVADIVNQTLSQFDDKQADTMEDHVKAAASPLLDGKNITLIVRELSAAFN